MPIGTLCGTPIPGFARIAVTFRRVPTDDTWVAALGSALGDPAEEVRLAAGRGLAVILFEHPAVIPGLVKALGDEKQSKAVRAVLDEHFEKTKDAADFGRVRGDLARLQVTLGAAIPALRDARTLKNEELVARVFSLLGRIVTFSRLSRDAELRKAIEPAVETYLEGLDDSSPKIRQEVLARLDAIPIRRSEIASALIKYLERSNLGDADRQTAVTALAAQSGFADSTPGMLELSSRALGCWPGHSTHPRPRFVKRAARVLRTHGQRGRGPPRLRFAAWPGTTLNGHPEGRRGRDQGDERNCQDATSTKPTWNRWRQTLKVVESGCPCQSNCRNTIRRAPAHVVASRR